ncbi:hypothetical protein [Leclercia sp.]|uniref:hypothetical protein n=1 Tax=Leclercia sp. TaxID=1898428 RepID=UPI0028AA37D3|nr:hypothetical protein [Leclercia sp.]
MTKKNGGPAFPQSGVCTPEIESWDSNDFGGRGLSMRDYFAAKVMQGVMASGTPMSIGTNHQEAMLDMALAFYSMADAMLSAREAS